MSESTEVRTTEIDSTAQEAAAEVQQRLIAERVRAGSRNAQARGKGPGRPRVAVDATRVAFLRAQGRSWRAISEELGIGKGTAQRAFPRLPKTPSDADGA